MLQRACAHTISRRLESADYVSAAFYATEVPFRVESRTANGMGEQSNFVGVIVVVVVAVVEGEA